VTSLRRGSGPPEPRQDAPDSLRDPRSRRQRIADDNRAWFLIILAAAWPRMLTAKEMRARPAGFAQVNSGIALNSFFKSAWR
jgi:hypothetical protein